MSGARIQRQSAWFRGPDPMGPLPGPQSHREIQVSFGLACPSNPGYHVGFATNYLDDRQMSDGNGKQTEVIRTDLHGPQRLSQPYGIMLLLCNASQMPYKTNNDLVQ